MPRAEAKYRITAEDRTQRGLRSAESRLRRFAGGTARILSRAAGIAGAAFVGLAAKLAQAAAQTEELNRRAKALEVTGNELAQLDFGARAAGVSEQAIADTLNRLDEFLLSLERGEETGADFFDNLGISGQRLSEIDDASDRIVALIEAFERLESPRRRQALLDELGPEAARLIAGGADEFRQAAARARALGINRGVEEQGAQASRLRTLAGEFGDAFADRLRSAFASVLNAATGRGAVADFLERQITSVGGGRPVEQSGVFRAGAGIALRPGEKNDVTLSNADRQLQRELNANLVRELRSLGKYQ